MELISFEQSTKDALVSVSGQCMYVETVLCLLFDSFNAQCTVQHTS